jgi:fatty-acyl-CoA synthase
MPTLLDRVDLRAGATPDLVQLIDDDVPVNIVDLIENSRRMAVALVRLGVEVGERVAIWLPNCAPWLVAFLACARIGAIAVAVNTRFRAAELGDILERCGARVLVMWPGFKGIDFSSILASVHPDTYAGLTTIVALLHKDAHPSSQVTSETRFRYIDFDDFLASGSPEAALLPAVSEDRVCIIFMTSGTSRRPKFVQHTLRSVSLHAATLCGALGLSRAEARLQLVMPLCGVFGFVQAIAALNGKAQLRIVSHFDAKAVARSLVANRITHLIGSDAMFVELMKCTDATPIFPDLEFCAFGAFTPSLIDLPAEAARRGLRLRGLYGSSEVFALFAIQDETEDIQERARPGGRPISSDARVRVTSDGSVMPHGAIAEIEIYSPSMAIGYFGDAQASASSFTEDGYFRTGDLGYTIETGCFVYLSRMGDVLRCGGYLVSPLEIEAIIMEDSEIAACQIVGITENGTERPCAFVIMHNTDSKIAAETAEVERRLIAHCRERTAQYKAPAHVFIVEAFPIAAGANGVKVQKNVLRKMAHDLLTGLESPPS